MTHITINVMGIKVREYNTEKSFEPDIIGFLKEMKKLEEETNGAVKVRASVSVERKDSNSNGNNKRQSY